MKTCRYGAYSNNMLNTNKPRRDNHYQPFSFDDFP
jgi:hypothetical protein